MTPDKQGNTPPQYSGKIDQTWAFDLVFTVFCVYHHSRPRTAKVRKTCFSSRAAMQSSSDRLVCDNHRTVHSSLACTRLRRTASSKVLSWCNICNFAGLGPASNLREGFASGYRSSSSSVPTPMATPEGDMEPVFLVMSVDELAYVFSQTGINDFVICIFQDMWHDFFSATSKTYLGLACPFVAWRACVQVQEKRAVA